MTLIQMKIIKAGVKIKLDRKESLEEILKSYVNLTPDEKQEIRGYFTEQ